MGYFRTLCGAFEKFTHSNFNLPVTMLEFMLELNLTF